MPVTDVLRQRMQPLAATVNSHRILLYSLMSTLAVSAAIANALKNHSNFYSVAIYLSKSSRSVLILANFGFLVALLCGRVVQHIFFGPLRAPEVERLYDRLWFFVTESLLAFTIFRDEFDIPFALMFGFLLFVKSFHWLASDRIEWMDQRPYPGPPTLFHVRMNALFGLLWATDFLMFVFAVESIATNGVGGMVLFASEYTILMASALNTMAKYVLSVLEIRRARQRGGENAPPWENKSMWVFYIELATDFLKLSTYLAFFTLIITFYGLPLNIVRDVYITARSFITRLRALHRYQTATRNMDQRYPNATEAEMVAMSDRTCIICREEMVLRATGENGQEPAGTQVPGSDGPNTTPKKLPCGHIFHFHCLRSWLERQQSCPTCRRTVLESDPPTARPPQPGAIPQQPNLFGFAGAQPGQPGQQPPNNGLGFVGRFFGVGAPPPIVPGQFVPGQLPPQGAPPQYPANPAWVPVQQQPGVTINIEYHVQGNQQQQQQPPPLQPLRPAPIFPGFQGPGGVWQPWGMDQRWFEPQNLAQRPQPTQSPAPMDHTPNSHPVPTPTQPQSTEDAESISEGDSLPNPRDAAAQAALRRFGAGRPTDGVSSSSSSISATETTASTRVPVATPSRESAATYVPNGTAHLDIPMLIPLHDIGPSLPASAASSTSRSPPAQRASSRSTSPAYPFGLQEQAPYRPSQHTMPRPTHEPLGAYRTEPASSHHRAASRQPLSRLPPALTDEQLAIMDSVTREAIDERLRVLEGVSGAVYRCMDDLLRMRSALPAPSGETPSLPNLAAPSNFSAAEGRHSTRPGIVEDESHNPKSNGSITTETPEHSAAQPSHANSSLSESTAPVVPAPTDERHEH